MNKISEHIEAVNLAHATAWILPKKVEEIVTFYGSFETQPIVKGNEGLFQELLVAMLDKGTKRRDKYALADILEQRGVVLSFFDDTLRVGFYGKCLKRDLPVVLGILAEQLQEPALNVKEFEKLKKRKIASYRNAIDSPNSQGISALTKAIYSPNHPNWTNDPQSLVDELQPITLEEVKAYHQQKFGSNGLHFSFVGETDGAQVESLLQQFFGDWKPRIVQPTFDKEGKNNLGETRIHIKDRPNLDVFLGQPIRLLRTDDSYHATVLANNVLGGNFSARLMDRIRDQKGLTYGIYSSLKGIESDYHGHFQVSVSLSKENLEKGIEATTTEISNFVAHGITEQELLSKKRTMIGSYQVGLSTTTGIAMKLQNYAEFGIDASNIDAYPEIIQALTIEEVNNAIQEKFAPLELHLVVAGSLEENR